MSSLTGGLSTNPRMTQDITYRTKETRDDTWISEVATTLWGSVEIISKDHTYDLTQVPTIVALSQRTSVGWISYVQHHDTVEIVALYTSIHNQGIGTTLINQVCKETKTLGCRTVSVVTTNDNTHALRFYQKRGFVLYAIRFNKLVKQRKKKPIPLLGNDNIPIRDEIELQKTL